MDYEERMFNYLESILFTDVGDNFYIKINIYKYNMYVFKFFN